MATTIHLGGINSTCPKCVEVATITKCDYCGTTDSVDTYTHDTMTINTCLKCEVMAEMAGEAYIAELREAE